MDKKFNYLAAAVLVLIINTPGKLQVWISKTDVVAVNLTANLVASILFLMIIPIVTIYFLRKFSNGLNIKNALIFGFFVTFWSFVLDSIVFGGLLGFSFHFLKNWIFSSFYLQMIIVPALTAIALEKR